MAARISRSSLTPDQIKTITSFLCMQPKASYAGAKNWFSSKPDKKPIQFYLTEGDDVVLPYTFFSSLTQLIPNQHKPFPPCQYDFRGELRPDQITVVDTALEHLSQHGTTLLGLYPGFGKTVVSAYLAARLNVKVLVIYNMVTLESQWLSTFATLTGARIGVTAATSRINIDDVDVVLSMDTKFGYLSNECRAQIGCLIIDEAHTFCTPSVVPVLLGIEPKYIVACTATPSRDDGMFTMMESMIGTHGIFRISDKPFVMIRFLTGIAPEIKKQVNGDMDWTSLVTSLCTDETRNNYIIGLVHANPEFKILILTWRKDHARLLYDQLFRLGKSVAILAGNIKTYSDSRILVGTISKVGTGFDEKAACPDFGGERINLLIMVGSTKSMSLIDQTIGRAFRSDYPHIITFVDDVPVIKRHWKVFEKWAAKRNGEVHDMYPPDQSGQTTEPPPTETARLASAQLARLRAANGLPANQ